MTVRFIVKLGGAAITDKSSLETLNDDALQNCVRHLKSVYSAIHETSSFVVVHGAGSFGHFQASRGGVDKGGIQNAQVKSAFVKTRCSVTKLNGIVAAAMVQAGIPAVGVSPCGFWTTSDRQVAAGPVEGIKKILDAGLIPVLHGDAVLDDKRGCTILSGDVIVKHLCLQLRPEFVVFMTNVDGIFDRNPSEAGATLIKRIYVQRNGEWKAQGNTSSIEFSTQPHDTTGGIQAKVAECASIACCGFEVFICKAGTESSLHTLLHGNKALETSEWRGTCVSFVEDCNQMLDSVSI